MTAVIDELVDRTVAAFSEAQDAIDEDIAAGKAAVS